MKLREENCFFRKIRSKNKIILFFLNSLSNGDEKWKNIYLFDFMFILKVFLG